MKVSRAVTINGAIFAIFLGIPLIAEYKTATPGNVPGVGFDVLLYEPFQFAYALLVTIFFVIANAYTGGKQQRNINQSVIVALLIAVLWFFASFLAVAQLHFSLGGKL